jgi:undecaprenyl-diphosphatase
MWQLCVVRDHGSSMQPALLERRLPLLDVWQTIVLGIVQGITEFLPISSDGHLVLVPNLLGWGSPSLLLITMLHWGTLLAIVVVFWCDFLRIITAMVKALTSGSWADPYARLGGLIILGSIPVALAGVLIKDWIEQLLGYTVATGFFLLLTAAVLAGSEWIAQRTKPVRTMADLNWLDALLIGTAQIFALLPGVSRSGSTIAMGLVRGIERSEGARFSFLLGAPAIFGAGLLETLDALSTGGQELRTNGGMILLGIVVSAITGLLAIRFLLAYLRTRSLYLFAVYCLIAGLVLIGFASF